MLLQYKIFTSIALQSVVLSAYGSYSSSEITWLIGHSFNADINLVIADNGGWLVVADVVVKSFEFWVVVVYAPNIAAERVFFYRRLKPFLDDPKRLVLTGDWNANLDPKIDRVGRENMKGMKAVWSILLQILFGSPREGDVNGAR